MLGVPTVADRVAQTVVASGLESEAEPVFHPDSYGYRPGTVRAGRGGRCRRRCWKNDWVIDLDIRKFFDTVPWDLRLMAVEAHTGLPWVMLYVKRWLAAPLRTARRHLCRADRGTPQGSAVSPVLANLFLHYAFDLWMTREFPAVTFERYVDDAVVHCASDPRPARWLAALAERMKQVGLRAAPGQDPDRVLQGREEARLA